MITGEASVTLGRPPEEVFRFVTDPANDPAWIKDVLQGSSTPSGPLRAGSRVHWTVKFMGRRAVDLDVVSVEPNRSVELQTLSGAPMGLTPRITYVLEPADGGTRFTRRIQAEPRGFGRLLTPMFRGMIPRYNRRWVANLERALQGS